MGWTTRQLYHQAVKIENCPEYSDRIEFTGDFLKNELTVKLKSVTLEDAGDWICELNNNKAGVLKFFARLQT